MVDSSGIDYHHNGCPHHRGQLIEYNQGSAHPHLQERTLETRGSVETQWEAGPLAGKANMDNNTTNWDHKLHWWCLADNAGIDNKRGCWWVEGGNSMCVSYLRFCVRFVWDRRLELTNDRPFQLDIWKIWIVHQLPCIRESIMQNNPLHRHSVLPNEKSCQDRFTMMDSQVPGVHHVTIHI